jgi:signal transduction histidine kinase/DNA-binding response OmpR family regulator
MTNSVEKFEDRQDFFHFEKVKILIVDDLPEKLMVYQTILEEMEQDIFAVTSGNDALKLLLKHEFAVILLDVNMPGMDGFEIANLIGKRKKSAHTPIIFLTAFTDEVCAAQGYASGAVDYLPTPVIPDVLRAKVRVFIELFQMRRQAAMQAQERAMRAAAEESVKRSEFIGNASKILAGAHKREDIVHSLLQIPVPYLSETSIVWFSGSDTYPESMKWTSRIYCDFNYEPPPLSRQDIPWIDEAIPKVMASRQVEIILDIPTMPFRLKEENTHAFELIKCAILLPILIRDQIYGILILTRKHDEIKFQPNEISLAIDFVSRTSIALENVLLIEKIQEADRRKDEFMGMLAHELRNPLGPVSNAIQLLKMMPKDSDFSHIYSIIDRQVGHMSRLIDDLLDATRLACGKVFLRKETCNLNKIIYQTVEDYQSIFQAKDISLEVDICQESLQLEADPTRLIQSIGNLLHNAHKFTHTGGTVSISLNYEQGGSGVIKISDNGIGIDKKIMPYVFDVFRQAEQGLDRAQGGLGLGLTLVKGLVELHDGTVSVGAGHDERGTEFTIRLPVKVGHNVLVNLGEEAINNDFNKYKILVIEDNKDAAESSKLLLALEGHDVKTANTGINGLAIAKSFQPQVILCDVGLPGMDGYQVAKSLRDDPELQDTYIIALTGYGRAEDQKRSRDAGFCMHLTKPIDYNKLHNVLANLENIDDRRLSVA